LSDTDFLALTVVLLVVIIVTILKHSGKNAMLLRFAAPLLAKRFIIESGRFIFIIYSVLWSTEGVLDNALKEKRDMQILVDEFLIVFLIVSIMWVIRLRNFEKFVRPHAERRRDLEEEAIEARRPPCDILVVSTLCASRLCLCHTTSFACVTRC
jgi:hypothetical protein